jgi:hypothetical protein
VVLPATPPAAVGAEEVMVRGKVQTRELEVMLETQEEALVRQGNQGQD